mgnify:CR=1 FL=1
MASGYAVGSSEHRRCRAIINAKVCGYLVDFPEERAEGFQLTLLVEKERVWSTVRVGQLVPIN